MPFDIRLLNRIDASFTPSPPGVLASGPGGEGVWCLEVLGDGKDGLLTRDGGDFAHAVVVRR